MDSEQAELLLSKLDEQSALLEQQFQALTVANGLLYTVFLALLVVVFFGIIAATRRAS